MPDTESIEKITLEEIAWNKDGGIREVAGGKSLKAQFNPKTLKVSFTNQKVGGDQKGGSAIQFVGKGTTKLSLDLLFDVTVPVDGTVRNDVRELTREVAFFMKPKRVNDQFVPPGVRVKWGSFLMEGIMDSVNETLEFFSSDGRPLRATVSIAMTRQDELVIDPLRFHEK